MGEEVEDMKSEEAMGIEIESWVLSDCKSISGQEMAVRSDWFLGQSSIKWRRECCESGSWLLRSWEEPKFLQFMKEELLLRRELEGTRPNPAREDSSYGICCFGKENWFSLDFWSMVEDKMDRPCVSCILSPTFSLFKNILLIGVAAEGLDAPGCKFLIW